MWPNWLAGRGFGASTRKSTTRPSAERRLDPGVRSSFFVNATKTRPVAGACLDVLRPVHRRRADEVRRCARLDEQLSLVGETGTFDQRSLAVHERQPLPAAVGIEACDVERAVIEQVAIRLAPPRITWVARHELVEVLELVVVARVDGDATVARQCAGGAFVRKAAERGALANRGARVVRIDLDDPSEAKRLPRFAPHVESRNGVLPAVVAQFEQRQTPVCGHDSCIGGVRAAVGTVAAEVVIEVLLGSQVGPPGSPATGAVGERAEDASCRAGPRACAAGRGLVPDP